MGRRLLRMRPSCLKPSSGTVKNQTVRVCRAGSPVWAPRDPPQLGEATFGLQSSPSSSVGRRCQLPWFPSVLGLWQGEGGPGPRGGSPGVARSTASLGSQSQSTWWLCLPSMRFERAVSRLQTDVSAVPSGGGCSRFCLPPPQSKQWGKKLGPASLQPESAPGWGREDGLPGP